MASKFQTPFLAVSSISQPPLCVFQCRRKHALVHSRLKASKVCTTCPGQTTLSAEAPDVPTTVSSMLSRSKATNTTTSTSFRDSLPSCSHRRGASQTALSMVRTRLGRLSSRFLGKVLLHLCTGLLQPLQKRGESLPRPVILTIKIKSTRSCNW